MLGEREKQISLAGMDGRLAPCLPRKGQFNRQELQSQVVHSFRDAILDDDSFCQVLMPIKVTCRKVFINQIPTGAPTMSPRISVDISLRERKEEGILHLYAKLGSSKRQ